MLERIRTALLTRSGLRNLFTQESFLVVFISEFLYASVDLVNPLIYAILDVRPIPQLFYDLVEIFSSTMLKSTSEKFTSLLTI